MVQKTSMSRGPYPPSQEIPMEVFDPSPQGKYSKRKGRFKRSDGSTSSDTTSNSFVRQKLAKSVVAPSCGAGRPRLIVQRAQAEAGGCSPWNGCHWTSAESISAGAGGRGGKEQWE